MGKTEVECCDVTCIHNENVKLALEQMPDEELLNSLAVGSEMCIRDRINSLADFYKAFADGTRVKILYVLQKSEMCVCDLAEILGVTQSAVSHQLRMLKQMKLVKNRRDGKTVYYSLADGHIQSIISQGLEHITE